MPHLGKQSKSKCLLRSSHNDRTRVGAFEAGTPGTRYEYARPIQTSRCNILMKSDLTFSFPVRALPDQDFSKAGDCAGGNRLYVASISNICHLGHVPEQRLREENDVPLLSQHPRLTSRNAEILLKQT